MRALVAWFLLGCSRTHPAHDLDLDLVRVSPDARLRTDTVGGAKASYPIAPGASPEIRAYLAGLDAGHQFTSDATFVLVDAENLGHDGANITLGGELRDATGAAVGALKPESLWVPAGEQRTFALVDSERHARPTASAAHIVVRGAVIPEQAPLAHIDEPKSYDDYGKVVLQGTLTNDAERRGQIVVFATFHDAHGQPMSRPFSLVAVEPHGKTPLQFVGPQGSTRGALYVGESLY